jgi:hypothetical protein
MEFNKENALKFVVEFRDLKKLFLKANNFKIRKGQYDL